MNFFAFAALICVFQFVRFSDACDGYDVKIKRLKCYSENNIKVSPGLSISLSDDCKVLINNATYSVEESFETAELTFDAKKDIAFGFIVSVLKETDLDLCKFLHKFNVPVECPAVETGTFDVVIPEPADIGEYRSMLCAAVGDVVVKGATICYDGCRTDTFDLTLTIFKKKK